MSEPTCGRPWHGPRVLAVGFVSYFVSTGLNVSILGVFIRPIAESFSASMATMAAVPSFYHVIGAVLGPLLGHRFALGGIRRFMLLGAGLLPLGLVLASRLESLLLAAACYGAIAVVGSVAMGPLAANTLVTHWYGPSRGRALGIVAAGATTAGILLPTCAAWLIGALGWRDALALLALASLLVTWPVFGAWAIDRPAALGQRPEAFPAEPLDAIGLRDADPAPLLAARTILAQPHFWAIAAGFGLLFSSSLISITFIIPYAEQLGLSLAGGATVLAARSLAAIAGQISLGWLSDRIGQRAVLWGGIATMTACWLGVVRAPSLFVFVACGIAIGFVSGSFAPLRGALVARVWGRRDFAKVSGLLASASLPFQVFTLPFAGWLYDRSGDYADAFGFYLVAFPVAALLVGLVPVPGPAES